MTINASPSVLSTIVTRANRLELLVLWRGSVGWFLRAGHQQEHFGGSQTGEVTMSLHYDRLTLDLTFDPARRVATLNGRAIPVPAGTNVLLVDAVDSQPGPTLFKSLVLDTGEDNLDPRTGSIAPLLRRSPDVESFLRCGDSTDTALNQIPAARSAQANGVPAAAMNRMLRGMGCDNAAGR